MGASWADGIMERYFDWLDHEIIRVTGGLVQPTVSAPLNRAALGTAADVAEALRRITAH